jgi:hypothetical protein
MQLVSNKHFHILEIKNDDTIMKYLKLILLLIITNYSYAQYGNYTSNNIAISILEPAIALEYSIAPKTTIRLRTAITSVARLFKQNGIGSKDYFISVAFHPSSSFAIRNYYNIDDRRYYRKRTDYNSANYFSLSAIYLFKNMNETDPKIISTNVGFIPAFLWGFQRSYSNRLFFDINFGPGYHINESRIMSIGELSLGIHL